MPWVTHSCKVKIDPSLEKIISRFNFHKYFNIKILIYLTSL